MYEEITSKLKDKYGEIALESKDKISNNIMKRVQHDNVFDEFNKNVEKQRKQDLR